MFLAKTEQEALKYIEENLFDVLVQEHCPFENEMSIYYIKRPKDSRGQIFSATHKIFPTVSGDGQKTLKDLVTAHPYYRWQSGVYFRRFIDRWNSAVPNGEVVQLVKSGNHAQGAVFKNGRFLLTEPLTNFICDISERYNGFYIGRYDIRYASQDDLLSLKNIKIIELNGAGGESTDVYDSSYNYFKIVGVLFRQWEAVFAIGAQNVKISKPKLSLIRFLIDLYKYTSMFKKYPIAN